MSSFAAGVAWAGWRGPHRVDLDCRRGADGGEGRVLDEGALAAWSEWWEDGAAGAVRMCVLMAVVVGARASMHRQTCQPAASGQVAACPPPIITHSWHRAAQAVQQGLPAGEADY